MSTPIPAIKQQQDGIFSKQTVSWHNDRPPSNTTYPSTMSAGARSRSSLALPAAAVPRTARRSLPGGACALRRRRTVRCEPADSGGVVPLRIERLGFGGALREGRKLRQRCRKRPIGRRGRRVLDQQGGGSGGYPGEIEVPGKGQQVADRGGIQGWRRFAQRSIPVGVGALLQGAGKGPQQELRRVAQRIVPVGALAVGISRGISGWLSGTSLLLRSFFRSVTTRHVYGDAGRGREAQKKKATCNRFPAIRRDNRARCTYSEICGQRRTQGIPKFRRPTGFAYGRDAVRPETVVRQYPYGTGGRHTSRMHQRRHGAGLPQVCLGMD